MVSDPHSQGRTDKHKFIGPFRFKSEIQKAQTKVKQVIFSTYRWKIYWKDSKLNLFHEIIPDTVLIHLMKKSLMENFIFCGGSTLTHFTSLSLKTLQNLWFSDVFKG